MHHIVLPLAKLSTLFIKQISKPIANGIAKRAKKSPLFSKYICMPPAQLYNWCEVRMKMWIMDLGKPVNIPKLNETMAIDLGASLLSEFIIFVIGAMMILSEVKRQRRKEAVKEAARKEEMNNLQNTILELNFVAERQDAQMKELLRNITDLKQIVVKVPWEGKQSEEYPPQKGPTDSLEEIRYYHRDGFVTIQKLKYLWTRSYF